MKYITLYACLLAFLVALALCWPEPMPHEPGYIVRQWCKLHPDVCQRGIRTVLRPDVTPSNKGYVVITP